MKKVSTSLFIGAFSLFILLFTVSNSLFSQATTIDVKEILESTGSLNLSDIAYDAIYQFD